MEFDELQKIWGAQRAEPFYALNVKALHNRILSKKKQAGHIHNFSELLLIVVNIGSGSFVLGMNFFNEAGSVFMYLLSVWMFVTATYVLINRIRRLMGELNFDRSLLGDLNHAIALATYQVNLSRIMRWNMLPVAILVLLGMWDSGKSLWISVVIVIFFALAHYAGGWEHGIYKNRKQELEVLREKLSHEENLAP